MRSRGICALVLLPLLALVGTTAARADAGCTFAALIAGYEAGLTRYQAKDFDGALAAWRPLVERGFPPALRRTSILHAAGAGALAPDLETAAVLARVAKNGGDSGAHGLVRKIDESRGPDAVSSAIERRAERWRPAVDCWTARVGELVEVGERRFRFGDIEVAVDPDVPERALALIRHRLPQAMVYAAKYVPLAHRYLPAVDRIEVLSSDLFDRYVGARVDADRLVVEMTGANILDDKPAFLVWALTIAAARGLYDRLDDSVFADPYRRTIGGRKVYGSVYPDIDNAPFFAAVEKALAFAEDLPERVEPAFAIIDEIHYTPRSERHHAAGTVDVVVGYYDRRLGIEGRRRVFIRRDMRWSSPADLLLTLVHEGTHALQDQRAERYRQELASSNAALSALEQAGHDPARDAKTLQAEIDSKRDYSRRWFEGTKTESGHVQDIAFECEALANEIRAARAIDAPLSLIESSQYLKLCENAQRLYVRWKNDKILGRR